MDHDHQFRTVRRTKTGDRYLHVQRCISCDATMTETTEHCTHQWRITQQKATCHNETLRWKCGLCDASLIEVREPDYTSTDWQENTADPARCADCQRILAHHQAAL